MKTKINSTPARLIKIIILFLAFVSYTNKGFAQDSTRVKTQPFSSSLYLETLGTGFTFSLNYEARLSLSKNHYAGFRLGYGGLGFGMINYYFVKNRFICEAGAGAYISESKYYPATALACRYHITEKFFMRLSLTPMQSPVDVFDSKKIRSMIPWGGVGFGWKM
jgi:hypothetical protein